MASAICRLFLRGRGRPTTSLCPPVFTRCNLTRNVVRYNHHKPAADTWKAFTSSKPASAAPSTLPSFNLIERCDGPEKITVLSLNDSFMERRLGDALSVVSADLSKFNHASISGLKRVISLLESSTSVSEEHALMLLHLSGDPIRELRPEKRQQFTDEIWKLLLQKGLKFEVTLPVYNAYLDARLQNKDFFNESVLKEMEKEFHLYPDMTTYQLLIKGYCETGELESAHKILLHMKNRGLSIGASVFDSLILGHMRKGDFAAKDSILATMEKAGLQITEDTQKTILLCWAEKGNIDQVMAEVHESAGRVRNSVLLDVVLQLADHGHQEHVPTILDLLDRMHRLFSKDVSCSCLELVAHGHWQTAILVQRCLTNSSLMQKAFNILRPMALSQCTMEEIEAASDEIDVELRQEGHFHSSLITGGIVNQDDPEYILKVFDRVSQERDDVFWVTPVFVKVLNAALEVDPDRVMSVWDFFTSCAAPGHASLLTLYYSMVKPMEEMGHQLDNIISNSKSFLSEDEIVWLKIFSALGHCEVPQFSPEEAGRLKVNPTRDHSRLVGLLLADFLRENFDEGVKALLKMKQLETPLCNILTQSAVLHRSAVNSQWTASDIKHFERLLNFFISKKLQVSYVHQVEILEALKKAQMLYIFEEKVRQLPLWFDFSQREGGRESPLQLKYFRGLSLEQLEGVVQAEDTAPIHREHAQSMILLKYCEAGNTAKALSTYEDMKAAGVVPLNFALRHLALLAVERLNNIPLAEELLATIEEMNPWNCTHVDILLTIAHHECRKGDIQGATHRLESFYAKSQMLVQKKLYEVVSPNTKGVNSPSALCERIFATLMARGNLDDTLQVTSTMFSLGFMDNQALRVCCLSLVSSFIKQGDLDRALRVYLRFFEQVQLPFSSIQLCTALLKAGRQDDYNKVVDAMRQHLPPSSLAIRLAIGLLNCGMTEEAENTLKPVAKSLTNEDIRVASRIANTVGDGKLLETLFDMLDKFKTINLNELFTRTLKTYINAEDHEGAFSFTEKHRNRFDWQQFAYFTPLVDLLQRNGYKVPVKLNGNAKKVLLLPDLDLKIENVERVIEGAVKERKFKNLISILKSAQVKKVEIPDELVAKIVAKYMLTMGDDRVMRKLLWTLADHGYHGILKCLVNYMKQRKSKQFLQQVLLNAYLNAENYQPVLEMLEEDPLMMEQCLNARLLASMPSHFNQLANIAKKHYKSSGNIKVIMNLIKYHVFSGEMTAVKELLEEFPDSKQAPIQGIFAPVQSLLSNYKDTNIIERVVDMFRGTPNAASVFSQAIEKRCSFNQLDLAQVLYDEALKAGIPEKDLQAAALILNEKQVFQKEAHSSN